MNDQIDTVRVMVNYIADAREFYNDGLQTLIGLTAIALGFIVAFTVYWVIWKPRNVRKEIQAAHQKYEQLDDALTGVVAQFYLDMSVSSNNAARGVSNMSKALYSASDLENDIFTNYYKSMYEALVDYNYLNPFVEELKGMEQVRQGDGAKIADSIEHDLELGKKFVTKENREQYLEICNLIMGGVDEFRKWLPKRDDGKGHPEHGDE